MTQSELKKLFTYEPITGEFTKISSGKVVGWIDPSTGYKRISVNSKTQYAHRAAYVYMTGLKILPGYEIDHDDHDRGNNIWSNLNYGPKSDNTINKTMSSKNTSGITGVTWDKVNNKWSAQIKIPGGKVKRLGRFKEKSDAISARENAEIKYGYHKNHGR